MRGAPVSARSGLRMMHPGLHRIGGQQHFGHEQDAVAEVSADDGHAGDQRLGQHVIGRPAAFDQDVDALFDLFLQTVIEVVVHLQHKLVVGKFGQDDFVVGHDALLRGFGPVMRRNAGRHSAFSDMPQAKADSKGAKGQIYAVNVLEMFYSSGMDRRQDTLMPGQRLRAAGAASNASGRFEATARVAFDDGWDIAETDRLVKTEVRVERARSALAWNRSPDLPFDRSINPYRGCEHGCIYCFARPSHAFLNLSPGLDFETRLVARPGIGAVLARELRARSYRVGTVAIGTNTDPYQPIEAEHRVMREVLEVLGPFVTRSPSPPRER
jgi:hypothetical protein